jgi:predicted DNA-binding transcriptional regulator AlpA
MKKVIYIADLAKILGKTEAAINSAHQRGQLPQSFKLLGRIAWKQETVDAWLQALEDSKPKEQKRAGRKRIIPTYPPMSQH